MSRINELKGKGFTLLSELDALLRLKKQKLSEILSPIEVEIMMQENYTRREHRRQAIMKGIESMNPEINN